MHIKNKNSNLRIGVLFSLLGFLVSSGCVSVGMNTSNELDTKLDQEEYCDSTEPRIGTLDYYYYFKSSHDGSVSDWLKYFKDKMLQEPNYDKLVSALSRESKYRQWVMLSYINDNSVDYGLLFIQYSSNGCMARYVRADRISSADLQIEQGFANFKLCQQPDYFLSPTVLTRRFADRENKGMSWSHPTRYFLNWGEVGRTRCGYILTEQHDLRWALELKDGRIFKDINWSRY